MADFIIGTTPVFTVQLSNGVAYDELGEQLFFRFRQNSVIVDVVPDISNNIATLKLTQEDTLRFKQGVVTVQLMGISGSQQSETVVKSDLATVSAKGTIINTAYHN